MKRIVVICALASTPAWCDDETWSVGVELTPLVLGALDLSVERAITKHVGIALLTGAGSSRDIVVGERVHETPDVPTNWKSFRVGAQLNAYASEFSGAHGGVEVVHVHYGSPSPEPNYDSVDVTDIGGYLGWKSITDGLTFVAQLGAKYFHSDLPGKTDSMAVLANFSLGVSW